MVEKQRTRIENGEEKTYTVKVPERRMRTATMTVMSPRETARKLTVPKGKTVEDFVREYTDKHLRPLESLYGTPSRPIEIDDPVAP